MVALAPPLLVCLYNRLGSRTGEAGMSSPTVKLGREI